MSEKPKVTRTRKPKADAATSAAATVATATVGKGMIDFATVLKNPTDTSTASAITTDVDSSPPPPPPADVKVRRGRKPKVVYNTFDVATNAVHGLPCSSDDEHIILKLNVNPQPRDDNDIMEPGPYNGLCAFSQFDEFDIDTLIKEDATDLPIVPKTTPATSDSKTLKVVELLKDFEEKNKNNEWPQTTSIHCYWCCHKFDNAPFGIPLKYVESKFHVYGCFCSLECASAYNFDSKDSHDEIWERYNLINLISKKIGQGRVKSAPARLALNMFGGHLSIEDFRDFCNTSKLININFPPMMTLTQQIEEINESDITNEFRYIPVDTDRINRYKEKISLKRTKPINSIENTLDHAMNLKFGISSN